MKLNVYSIHDSKVGAFAQPFFSHNHASAARTVTDAIADGDSQLARHPEDFSLHCVGEWDDQAGLIKSVVGQNLGSLTQWRREPSAPGPLLKAMGGR